MLTERLPGSPTSLGFLECRLRVSAPLLLTAVVTR